MNYTHDCDRCQFMGTYEWKDDKYDLYVCIEGSILGNVCYIARFGNEGSEYISQPEDFGMTVEEIYGRPELEGHPIVECKRRYESFQENRA